MSQTVNKQLTENGGQGMNWIRREKRLAIYLRDGLACVWCGLGLEEILTLTLDHVVCRKRGIDNDAKNLVTACLHCNQSRGSKTVKAFARVIGTRDRPSQEIVRHVNRTRLLAINVIAAHRIICKRGGFVAALKGLTK